MFGGTEGRRFGINRSALFACVCMFQDVQPFRVRCHQSIFNAVVDHLDEVARAVWPAMQVAFLSGTFHFLASGRAFYVSTTRSKRFENRIKVLNDLCLTTDHLAVAAIKSPDTTTG